MRFSMPERCEDGETKKEAVCVGEDGHDADEKVHWERISPVEFIPLLEETGLIIPAENGCCIRQSRPAAGGRNTFRISASISIFPMCSHEEPCPDGDTDSAAPVWIRAFRGGN